MKQIYKYIFSTCLLFCNAIGTKSVQARPVWQPKYMHIAVDATRPIYYGLLRKPVKDFLYYGHEDKYKYLPKPECKGVQYEFNTSVNFTKWILEGDFGWGNTEWKGANFPSNGKKGELGETVYKNKGVYFRLGFNYNMLKDTPDNNSAFIGARYAMSFSNDSLSSKECYNYDRDGKPNKVQKAPQNVTTKQDGIRATWFEVLSGLKVKAWGPVYVGFTLRYKFALSIYNADLHEPFEILGWGLNNDVVDRSVFGYNCYISLCIPFGND